MSLHKRFCFGKLAGLILNIWVFTVADLANWGTKAKICMGPISSDLYKRTEKKNVQREGERGRIDCSPHHTLLTQSPTY